MLWALLFDLFTALYLALSLTGTWFHWSFIHEMQGVRQNLMLKWLKFRDSWNHACRNSINRISPYFEEQFRKKMFFAFNRKRQVRWQKCTLSHVVCTKSLQPQVVWLHHQAHVSSVLSCLQTLLFTEYRTSFKVRSKWVLCNWNLFKKLIINNIAN